jgi:hypothetical protein
MFESVRSQRVQRAVSLRVRAGREPEARTFLCLSCLFFPIARWRIGRQRMNQPLSGLSHFIDCPVECNVIRSRGTIHAAQLPNELNGGRANLIVGGGWTEVSQCLDVSTHDCMLSSLN